MYGRIGIWKLTGILKQKIKSNSLKKSLNENLIKLLMAGMLYIAYIALRTAKI